MGQDYRRSQFFSRIAATASLAAASALVAMAGCAGPDDMDQELRARVVEQGDAVASHLMETLSGQLGAAVAEGGPAHAVDFCAVEARDLTDRVARERGPGWEVKRTTLRPRNQANAPDGMEFEALQAFHAAESAGRELPANLVQRTPAGDFRYYRPLLIAPLCVECHGPAPELDADVARALAERYPGDEATGYQAGDLRGLIRVTIPADALAPAN